MSDHWNTLANLLGTPSIDPIQRKSDSPSVKKEKPKEKQVNTADSSSGSSYGDEPSPVEAVQAKAEPPAKPEPTSRLRSSWDTVARLFGVASAPEETPDKPAPAPETAKPSSFDSLFSSSESKPSSSNSLPSDDELFCRFRKEKGPQKLGALSCFAKRTPVAAIGVATIRIAAIRIATFGASSSSHESSRHASRNESNQEPSKRKKRPSFWGNDDDQEVAATSSESPVRSRGDSRSSEPTEIEHRHP